MTKKTALCLAAAALLAGAASAAGPLYRCGNSFQDRPCDAGVEQQTLRPGKGAGANGAVPAAPVRAETAASGAPAAAASSVAEAPRRPASALRKGSGPACPGLLQQANAIDERLQKATNPNTIQMLQRQRQSVDHAWAEAGC